MYTVSKIQQISCTKDLIFGRKIEGSIPVKMLKTEVDKLLKTDHKGSQVMLDVDGQTYDALIKEVDFNPLAGRVDEIDF